MGEMDDLLALQAVAYKLFSLPEDMPAAERSTETQALGEQVEAMAKALVVRVRQLRGLGEEEARPALQLASREPEAPKPVDTGAKVRDAVAQFSGGFTTAELAAELGYTEAVVKKLIRPMLISVPQRLRDTGFKMGRRPVYEYVKPPVEPTPARPRHTPPEKLPPAGTERRATGEPVRVAAVEKITRRSRSTPGVRHLAVQRDKRYEAMQEARRQAAAEQQRKAHQDRK
jgi:hypothetical protein